MKTVLVAALVSLLCSILCTPMVVVFFRHRGFGQEIRNDGPPGHLIKRGTPTMGGVAIVGSTIVGYFFAHLLIAWQNGRGPTASGLLLLFLMAGLGAVGFLDDFIKIRRQRSLGLRARAKIGGQLIVAVAFGVLALQFRNNIGLTPASTHLSYVRDIAVPLGSVGFVVVAYIIIAATSNAVNLTDGLDGLAAGAAAMVFGAFTLIAFIQFRNPCTPAFHPGCYYVRDPLDMAMVAASAMAACFGFLWWNASPAQIFMGDTGSMALGGLLAGLAILTRTELLLVVLGGLFGVVTLSGIVQASWFKFTRWKTGTGRRAFKMSPLHHHFEMSGWQEVTIIVRFWIIAGIAVAFGMGLFYAEFIASGDQFVASFTGRTVLVCGARFAGLAAVQALLRRGARVLLSDQVQPAAVPEGVQFLGELNEVPDGVELIVTSPGWQPSHPLFASASNRGIEVIGEVEFAWRLRASGAAPWLAVTGTNGKTTTVRMLESILQAAGLRAIAVGNVGVSIIDAVDASQPYDVLAVELSSFQLYWSSTVHPLAGAILNVAPDHLDWHGSMTDYVEAKTRIWNAEVAIGNRDDPAVSGLIGNLSWAARRVDFTLSEPADGQLGVIRGTLVDRAFGAGELFRAADVRPSGSHNIANALAASALALASGVRPDAIAAGLRSFVPDPHRNQFVASVDGVDYVDDSKATNPHAASASLMSYDRIIWIAGGQLKGAPVDDLVTSIAPRLGGVVLLGVDRGVLRAALMRHAPDVPVIEVALTDDRAMSEVVNTAAVFARPGDTVLLAPAAASYDMFTGYAARGNAFAAAVRARSGHAPGDR